MSTLSRQKNNIVSVFAYNRIMQERIFAILFSVILLLLVSYVYLVGSSVMHVVLRKETVAQISTLRADMALIESDYLQKTNSLTRGYADELGFTAVSGKQYIERTVLTARAN